MARPTLSSMAPGILAAIAFILSLYGCFSCKFLSFESIANGSSTPFTLNFGIWNYQGWSYAESQTQGTLILESCKKYPDYMQPRRDYGTDWKWQSARAFSTMTLIIGGVVTFWALLAGCLYPSKQSYKLGGMAYMLCCLFSGLSLLFLDSHSACHSNMLVYSLHCSYLNETLNLTTSSCSMASGAKCTIAATVMWFVAAIAALKVDPPERSPIAVEPHDVTYTKTTGVNGAAVVPEVVVKGDPVAVGGQETA